MAHEAEALERQVKDALQLIEALERAKKPVPPTIKLILKAMDEGVQIGMSAEEASQHFALFIKSLDKQCGIGDPTVDQDDAFICLAKRERTEGSLSYAGRVNFVLNKDNPLSFVSIYWNKKKRAGWACVWDELRNGSPSGLYRKCFLPPDVRGHIQRMP